MTERVLRGYVKGMAPGDIALVATLTILSLAGASVFFFGAFAEERRACRIARTPKH